MSSNPRLSDEAESKQKQFTRCLTNWMRILAETTKMREGEQLTPEKIKSYLLVLVDVPIEDLDRGLQRCSRECIYFPTAAEIRERCTNFTLAAEQAWDLVEQLVRHDWYADGIDWVNGSEKKLTPAMQYAIRQCGGEYRLAYCDETAFPFIRRDFLVAHERFNVEHGDQLQLTQGEARTMLGKIREARQELLPEIPEGAIAEAIPKQEPKQQTRDEYEARMAELKRQAAMLTGGQV